MRSPEILTSQFDAVVMLTMSNWHTEMRGNRYHYATRFARYLPVIFVQADLEEPRYEYEEETEVCGLRLLHVYRMYGWKQGALLKAALAEQKISRPILWVYNHDFIVFLATCQTDFTVYHATEDYFATGSRLSSAGLSVLRKVLGLSDVLVAVSQGVKNSYQVRGGYRGDVLVVENGCDFKFWAPSPRDLIMPSAVTEKRIAFYQGGIHRKIDFALMHELARRMSHWEFWFCGEVYAGMHEWHSLSRHANVKYFGKLRPEHVRELAYQSSVGLIPFIQNDSIIERSFPLKAFEYVACGLPVISVPIKALQPFSDVVTFATSAEQFMEAMNRVAPTRHDAEATAQRLKIARQHDYDLKFQSLLSTEAFLAASQLTERKRLQMRHFRYKWKYKSIFLIEGMRKELGRIQRAVGRYVIHLCALAVAGIARKDPGQLEHDLLRFSRKMRGIPVPGPDTPTSREHWLKGG